jgi:hypothetical protein
MTDSRRTPDVDRPSRPGAVRRAASGIVAGYIHELSERHGRTDPDSRPSRKAGSSELDDPAE